MMIVVVVYVSFDKIFNFKNYDKTKKIIFAAVMKVGEKLSPTPLTLTKIFRYRDSSPI